VIVPAVDRRVIAGPGIVEIGPDLRVIRHRGQFGVLLGHHDGLTGDDQIRPVLQRPLQTVLKAQIHGKILQRADILHVRVGVPADQGVELRRECIDAVLGSQQKLFGRGHVHLGLQHVELRAQSHLVEGGIDLQLRTQPHQGVLGGTHVLARLEEPQKRILDGDGQLQFGVVDL